MVEDALQDTFLTAIEDADAWDAERPVLPWLLGVLANRVRMARRKARPQELDRDRLVAAATGTEDADPSEVAASDEFVAAARAAVRGLHEPYRQVLVLHLEHGLAAGEIADVLGRPAGTVRTQVVRGLELLRQALPVGFAAAAVVGTSVTGAAAEALLSGVRAQVLAQFALTTGITTAGLTVGTAKTATAVGGAATTTWWLLGVPIAMKKVVMVGLVGVLALGVWQVTRSGAVATGPDAGDAGRSRVVVEDSGARQSAPSVGETAVRRDVAGPSQPGAGQPAIAALTGSVRLRLLRADGTPAVGARVVRWSEGDRAHRFVRPVSAVTDAAGEVVFGELAPGAQSVCLSVPQSSRNVWPEVRAGEEVVVEERLPAGASVRGRVVDAGGLPVPDAALLTLGNYEFHQEIARTDGEGHFAITALPAHQQLLARATGHGPSEVLWPDVAVGGEVEVTLRLGARASRVSGFVEDPTGRRLADARVAFVAVGAFHNAPPLLVMTNAEGEFEVAQLLPGRVVVTAVHEGAGRRLAVAAEWEVPPQGLRDAALVVTEGATIHGVAREVGGGPLQGWQVVATPQHPLVYSLPFARQHVYTDAQGRYRIEGVLPGLCHLRTSRAGPDLTHEVECAAGQEVRWDPLLESLADIRIAVVDEAGAPLVGWRVETLNADGFPTSGHTVPVEGPIVFGERAPGEHHFWVSATQRIDDETGVPVVSGFPVLAVGPVAAGESRTVTVRRDQLPTGVIRGRVLRDDGTPCAEARVELSSSYGWGARETVRTAADGTFVTPLLPPETYRLDVRVEGAPRRVVTDVVVAPGADVRVDDVVMPPAAWVEVELRGDSAATAGAVVHIVGRRSAAALSRDGEGWRSGVLAPGRYRVQVSGPAVLPESRVVEVAGAGAARTEFEVRVAPARQALRLVLPPDRPDPSRWTSTVTVRRAPTVSAEPGDVVVRTEAEGRVADPAAGTLAVELGLEPGEYVAEVVGWDDSTGRVTFRVVAGGRSSVDVVLR